MLLHAATVSEKRVLFFSVEMGQDEICERLLASISGVDAGKIRRGQMTGEELGSVVKAAGKVSNSLLILDDADMTPIKMRLISQRIQAQGGLDLVAIDYLQLLHTDGKSEGRQWEMAEISRQIKRMARELDAPILALSQLNRQSETRENRRPRLADLRESGALEQDADIVALIHRPGLSSGEGDLSETIIDVAKNRHGMTGDARIRFEGAQFRFTNAINDIG
jgi:replicative DNA helicase